MRILKFKSQSNSVGHSLRSRIRALCLLFLAIVSPLGLISFPSSVFAATGNILPPFTTGETWCIYQGYSSGTHVGTSQYGLDLTDSSCSTTGAAGKAVRAPISGTLAYPYQASYGNLCVNISGGRSYTLTHINSSATGSITAGQVVGTVGSAGSYNNNGVAHIHFEMWSSPNCYNSSVIPFSVANNARICGAPDLTASGPSPNGNGVWGGVVFTGDICGSTAFTAVSYVIDAAGVSHVFSGTSDGKIYDTFWGNGTSLGTWQVASGLSPVTSIAARTDAAGVNHIYSGTSAGTLNETYWGGGMALGTWQVGIGLGFVTSISSMTDVSGVNHIYSGTSSGVIRETYWGGGMALGTWQLADL